MTSGYDALPIRGTETQAEGSGAGTEREQPIGFHWRDGWTLLRLENGDVRVRLYRDARCDLLVEEQVIPSNEWASIVAAVNGESYPGERDAEIARLQRELAAGGQT